MVKLIILVVVIAAVFFAFKHIKKIKAERDAKPTRQASARDSGQRPGWARRVFKSEVLVECPRCRTFVASLNDHACRGKS